MNKGMKECLSELEAARRLVREKEEEYRLLSVAERFGGPATLARLVADVPKPKPVSFKSKIITKGKPKDEK